MSTVRAASTNVHLGLCYVTLGQRYAQSATTAGSNGNTQLLQATRPCCISQASPSISAGDCCVRLSQRYAALCCIDQAQQEPRRAAVEAAAVAAAAASATTTQGATALRCHSGATGASSYVRLGQRYASLLHDTVVHRETEMSDCAADEIKPMQGSSNTDLLKGAPDTTQQTVQCCDCYVTLGQRYATAAILSSATSQAAMMMPPSAVQYGDCYVTLGQCYATAIMGSNTSQAAVVASVATETPQQATECGDCFVTLGQRYAAAIISSNPSQAATDAPVAADAMSESSRMVSSAIADLHSQSAPDPNACYVTLGQRYASLLSNVAGSADSATMRGVTDNNSVMTPGPAAHGTGDSKDSSSAYANAGHIAAGDKSQYSASAATEITAAEAYCSLGQRYRISGGSTTQLAVAVKRHCISLGQRYVLSNSSTDAASVRETHVRRSCETEPSYQVDDPVVCEQLADDTTAAMPDGFTTKDSFAV